MKDLIIEAITRVNTSIYPQKAEGYAEEIIKALQITEEEIQAEAERVANCGQGPHNVARKILELIARDRLSREPHKVTLKPFNFIKFMDGVKELREVLEETPNVPETLYSDEYRQEEKREGEQPEPVAQPATPMQELKKWILKERNEAHINCLEAEKQTLNSVLAYMESKFEPLEQPATPKMTDCYLCEGWGKLNGEECPHCKGAGEALPRTTDAEIIDGLCNELAESNRKIQELEEEAKQLTDNNAELLEAMRLLYDTNGRKGWDKVQAIILKEGGIK